MAEETSPQVNLNDPTDKGSVLVDKQTNRTFTQSEVDKMIKGQSETESSKYSDYDSVKTQLEELKLKQQEREEAELSDLDLSNKKNLNLEAEIAKLKGDISTKDQGILKQEVLNDPKYSDLPSAYKQLVVMSSKKEEVALSADEMLNQFNSDFKVSQDFGIPKELKVNQPVNTGPINLDDMKAKLKARLAG